jgi:hypothetical protein
MNLINKPHALTPDQIDAIEQMKDATWVMDLEYRDVMHSVFHQAVIPDVKGATNFFGVIRQARAINMLVDAKPIYDILITNADWITKIALVGIEARNGDVVMSHHRHHFHESEDGSVFIDGGTSYTRYGGAGAAPEQIRKITISADGLSPVSP